MEFNRQFLTQFDPYFEAINKALTHSMGSPLSQIDEIMAHSLLGEGKRLRPLLFVLCAETCGYRRAEVYRYSTIFEYIHTASLLHDDVLDNAETRRKRPAVRNVWGNSAAILGGDYLYARASAIALECGRSEVIQILSSATTRMVEGQFLELEHTHDWHLLEEQYMQVIRSKTAELIAAACSCGGVIADATREAIRDLGSFGLNLGISFQLIDDLLDYFACEEEFGKPVGKDLREGKITLPLIYALKDLTPEEAERLATPFRENNVSDEIHSETISLVRKSGVHERIKEEAGRFAGLAADALASFPESRTRESLLALNRYLVQRSF
jgi:octaprenyl-diphosphate synthase